MFLARKIITAKSDMVSLAVLTRYKITRINVKSIYDGHHNPNTNLHKSLLKSNGKQLILIRDKTKKKLQMSTQRDYRKGVQATVH